VATPRLAGCSSFAALRPSLNFFQLCQELSSGGINIGFHLLLIDPYFSLHCLCLDLQHVAELLVKVVPYVY
jgi:hypothetical protein